MSFFTFDLERIFSTSPALPGSLLKKVVRSLNNKTLTPLPHRTFPVSEIGEAIAYMSKGRHMGKIVTSSEEPGVVPVPSLQKIRTRTDGTYLITGGFGGFGLEVAKWLASCGAEQLVLIGRTGASTADAQQTVAQLEKTGVTVIAQKADITNERQLGEIIEGIDETMPRLRGVVHAAMVLDDEYIATMTEGQMKKVMDPKVIGAWNLHRLTKDKPLDFFISFSSFVSMIGNPGQGNYSAANSFLNSLAHYRRAKGMPALTICWGVMSDFGYLVHNARIKKLFNLRGFHDVTASRAWQVIRNGIKKNLTEICAISMDWNKASQYSIPISDSPRFSDLVQTGGLDQSAGKSGINETLPDEPEKRKEYLTKLLAGEIAGVLGISQPKLDIEKPLDSLGFDSLMASELLVEIERGTGVKLSPMELLSSGLTVSEIAATVNNKLTSKKLDNDLPDGDKTKISTEELLKRADEFSEEEIDKL